MGTANSTTKKKRPKIKPSPSPLSKEEAIIYYVAHMFYDDIKHELKIMTPKKKPLKPVRSPVEAISHYMASRFYEDLRQSLKEVMCNHKWIKYGHGYQCEACEYYTGDNNEMNTLIKKYLKSLPKA